MLSALQDLRIAVRQLRRSGSFTATVILTLALGIGLNAAIFTMVDCVLLRPLGYHDADRIYALKTRFIAEARSIPSLGGGDYADAAKGVKAFESSFYYMNFKDGLQTAGRTHYVEMTWASPGFGPVMGVEPIAGRLFHNEANGLEVLMSNAFARETFGSAQQALGQAVHYDNKVRTVVGVLPDGFSFPGKSVVWIEAPANPENMNRTAYNQRAIFKVRAGVPVTALNAELNTFSQQLAASYPEDKSKALEAVPLQEQIVGKIRPTLRLLMASVGVLLLIVCANITHLQLVRATQLRREVTIRTALGATRKALARRAAIEVLLLAIGGCALGVLIAVPALRLLIRLAPQDVPRLADVHLNLDVVGFSFLISVVTMAATAMLPLWRSWRIDPASAMKQDAARGMESRASGRLRQGLIVGEVALTLVLSVAALLLVRQLIAESKQDLGFEANNLVMLDTHDGGAEGTYGEGKLQSLVAMEEGVRSVPGVKSVGSALGAPMGQFSPDVRYAVHGVSEFKPGVAPLPDANIVVISPGYFETMGIRQVAGRGITRDDNDSSEKVLVISEAMAKQSFANENPIGRQIMCGYDNVTGWWTIVGVVSDVRQDSPASAPYPTFYVPIAQHPLGAGDMQVMVRTRMDAGTAAGTLERYLHQKFPIYAVRAAAMRENVGESERAERFRTMLFASFAGVSILLAMTGMYGVTAYTVAQRRFEFALRFALGAQRGQVLGSVVQRALVVAAIGVAAGIGLSLGAMRVMQSLIGALPAFDAIAYAVAAAGVLLIAVSATLLPAYRAAMVEPMQVLRDE